MDPTYAQHYLFIAMLSVAGIGMAVLPLVLARFIAPKKPGHSKQSSYECGMESTGDPWVQFRLQ